MTDSDLTAREETSAAGGATFWGGAASGSAGSAAQLPSALTLAQSFSNLTRRLSGLASKDEAYTAIVQAALTEIPGAEAAGLTVLRGDHFRTLAPSGELPERVDAIQYELRSGPCVDAVLEGHIYCSAELADDERWPTFGKRASVEYGVHSMMAHRLFLDDGQDAETIGSLNLYATRPGAFDGTSLIIGSIFATHAALAFDSARNREEAVSLRLAQNSNREIGMAMGVLMSSQRLTQSQAFDLLRIASQHSHRKLRDLASDVVQTGMLDFPPSS